MEQHAVPREVISFTFKLIGPLTLRQFVYLAVGGFGGWVVYFAISQTTGTTILGAIPGLMVLGVAAAFVFVPINDRPMEVFLKNLYTRLRSPTQYIYHKDARPLRLLEGLYYDTDPHIRVAHIDSKEKLALYLASTKPPLPTDAHRAVAPISQLFTQPPPVSAPPPTVASQPQPISEPHPTQETVPTPSTTSVSTPSPVAPTPPPPATTQHVFMTGTVTNRRNIPLPGILIYVKDPQSDKVLRILKTNPHGVFASFHPLPGGSYLFQIADPLSNYQFDPVTSTLDDSTPAKNIFTFVSREQM